MVLETGQAHPPHPELVTPKDPMDLYLPLASANEFEDPNLRIENFTGVRQGEVVIGSGSPRNRRFTRDNSNSLSQLSLSAITQELASVSLSPELQEIVRAIQSFREPRKAWHLDDSGTISDDNVSLAKARMAAAAAIMYQQELLRQDVPTFSVVGKDNNTAAVKDGNITFFERPGFVSPSFAEDSQIPTGWSREGDGDEPAQPAEQIVNLYGRHSQNNFICVNSTTVLKISEKYCTPEGLRWLVDLNRPLEEEDFTTVRSCMLLQGDAENIVMELFNYYSDTPLRKGGERMYAIPGMVDWSRPPFRDHLKVWVPSDGSAIRTDLPNVLSQVANQQGGSWQPYLDLLPEHQEIEDELVGASTHSLRRLM